MDYRERYPWVLRALSSLIDLFLASAGLLVLILIFTNVILRGAAGFSLAWSLEVTAFALLWLTFLGCAAAMARGAHMRVTEIVGNLAPKPLQRLIEVMINLIVILLLGSLIHYGYIIAAHTWAQKTTVLYWPVGLLYASLPVGMALTLIFHLFNCVLDLRSETVNSFAKPAAADAGQGWEDYE